MNPFTISLLSFGFIFNGILLGFYLGKRLPAPHLSSDSKEAVKTTAGMIATMSALVLSLLVASAKSTFDGVSRAKTEAAAQIVMLDHLLVQYGPQADPARDELRQAVSSEIASDDQNQSSSASLENANSMELLEDRLGQLFPSNDLQHELLFQARKITNDLFQGRVMVIEQSHTTLPNVLLFALIGWLTLLFVGISLFAPRNKTVLTTLTLCVLSLSFAIFLINDMNQPLHGLLNVSNAPMREALAYLNRH